jgi:hypothetical protein
MQRSFWRFAVVFAFVVLGASRGATASEGATQLRVCSSGCPYVSIRAAIGAASPGDTIVIQPGTYTEQIMITKNLTLVGQDATIDGGGPLMNHSAIIVERGVTLAIDGLTITNGYSPDFGGGILNYGRLTLKDSQVVSNTARADGGGIYNNGVLTLQDSEVSNNSSGGPDGGIANDIGTVRLTNSVVANNLSNNCTETAPDPSCRS